MQREPIQLETPGPRVSGKRARSDLEPAGDESVTQFVWKFPRVASVTTRMARPATFEHGHARLSHRLSPLRHGPLRRHLQGRELGRQHWMLLGVIGVALAAAFVTVF